jgi:hypothetical protein
MIGRAWRIDGVSDEAVLGWRSWRVLRFESFGGQPSYRLCACGTRGIPKVWEPLEAVRAVCSGFRSQHEAPWPDHECGIYAYREDIEADRHLHSFREALRDDESLVGWARGRASLWGRVIEHELGWRAQYAYPYDMIVHAEPEVAEAIRTAYLVDVKEAAPLPRVEPEEHEDEDDDELVAELRSVEGKLRDLETRLGELAGPQAAPSPRVRNQWRHVDLYKYSPEALARVLQRTLIKRQAPAALSRAVADELAGGDSSDLLHPSAVSETAIALKRASMAGLVVQLRAGGGQSGPCYWTTPGREHKAEIAAKGLAPVADRFAEADNDVLAALRKAVVAAKGSGVRILAVLDQLGWAGPERTKSREASVAQALVRLEQRRLARSERGYPTRWAPA